MILTLTALGLILIPFYDVIFRLFPNVFVIASDTRLQREMMAVIIALAIGLLALYQGKLKPFKNKWLLLFVGFQMVTINLMPKISLVVNNADSSGFWVWKPMFEIICFLLMGVALSSIEIDRLQVEKILNIMCYVAFAQAIYIVLQTFGLDQFFQTKGENILGGAMLKQFPERVGTLGQPTLVSPFIAMCVPIAFYLKKYIISAIIILGVLLTHSQMAIGALIFGVVVYSLLIRPRSALITVPLLLSSTVLLFLKKIFVLNDNGRLGAWKMTLSDILQSPLLQYKDRDFSFFGNGIGSFRYISTAMEQSGFAQVHNDYLEIFYGCGIFGIILFIAGIIYLLISSYKNWLKVADYKKTMMSSLICSFLIISLCALGTFVWQLGAHIFYTVVIASLLMNETITGGGKCLKH